MININGNLTSKGSKVRISHCSICIRKKSMTISDNMLAGEGLGELFKYLGKRSVKVARKLAKSVLKNRTRALDNTANIATAPASKNPQNVLSTLPELMSFYNTGEALYLGKFEKFMLYERNKKQTGYTHLHH